MQSLVSLQIYPHTPIPTNTHTHTCHITTPSDRQTDKHPITPPPRRIDRQKDKHPITSPPHQTDKQKDRHTPQYHLTSPSSSLIMVLNCRLSITKPSSLGCKMPHFDAMARAVFTLSPVTMRTVTPALWHNSMALGTCRGRGRARKGSEGGPRHSWFASLLILVIPLSCL